MARVSVLLPVYNCEKYIRTALLSVLNQTYDDVQVVVLNDASKDKTEEAIADLLEKKNVTYIKNEKNMGLVATLNRGIQSTDSEFIARMDADDISHIQRFEEQVSLAIEKNLDLVGADSREVDELGRVKKVLFGCNSSKLLPLYLLHGVPFAHATAFMRRSFVEKNDLAYGKRFKFAEDYALWWDFQIANCKYGLVRSFLMDYRVLGASLSQNNAKKIIQDKKAIIEDAKNRMEFARLTPADLASEFENLTEVEIADMLLPLFILNPYKMSLVERAGLFMKQNLRVKADFMLKGPFRYKKYY